MVADPVAADHVRLMFEMYAEPETSFGDITRDFVEHDIKIYGKSMFRTFLSQLLRNPVYAQADLELYEFFKSQGAAIVNDASDFAGTNGCYLYQGRDVKEDKDRCLKDQILVIAPHEALISSDTWLKCRKKLMANTTFQQGRKPKNTWMAGKIKCGHCGYALKATHAYEPIHAGKGWKNAIVTWYQKFKESVFFRRLFFLAFVTSLILFRTLLNRQLWMNPLFDVMGGWGIWETVNGEQKLTTECIENVIMMVPFTSMVIWTFQEKVGSSWKKILWYSGKVAFIFSISILPFFP